MREISLTRSLVAAALVVIGPLAAIGEPVTESAVVQPQPLPPDYWFGHSVAADGNVLVVGADNSNEFDGDPGSAYVFVLAGDGKWVQQAHLSPDDGQPFDEFGAAVGVSGDTVLVGASHADGLTDGGGAAYVFKRNPAGQWSQQDKLEVSGTFIPLYFGRTLGIDGSRAVFGTASDAAFIFEADAGGEWSQTVRLLAPSQYFGRVVDLDGDRVVGGATGDGDMGIGAGAAYIFVRGPDGAWSIESKLTAPDGEALDFFGCSVAIDGTLVVVGSCRDDDNGYNAGAAYVFDRALGTWQLAGKLLSCDGETWDDFGHSVAVSGQRVVVGAHHAGTSGGAVYVFEPVVAGGEWAQAAKLTASDVGADLGWAVAATGLRVAASEPDLDRTLVYELDELPPRCVGDIACDGTVDVQDLVELLEDWGPCPGCISDLDQDAFVGIRDLLGLLASWGPC